MKYRNTIRVVISACALTTSMAAFAQQEAAPNSSDDTIVVTASRQGAMSAQDVPIAVSAVDPLELSEKGLGGLQDIARMTPGLNVVQSTPGVNRIDIRGLTTGLTAASNVQDRPLVAVYLDDVPMSLQGYSPDIRVFDLERVEVIRGPQGTLYGAGSMAGTIRYITAKPTTSGVLGSVEGIVSTSTGGGVNYSLRGIVNLPLTENLALRAGGYQGRNDGYIDNVGLGKNNANSDESTQFRVAARWTPAPNVTLDASVTVAKLDVNGLNASYPRLGKNKYTSIVPEGFNDNLKIYNFTAEVELDFATLTSSSAYLDRHFSQNLTFEQTGPQFGFPGRINALGVIKNNLEDFSQELRIVSAKNDVLNWSAGGFYQSGKRHYYQNVTSPGFDAAYGALRGNPNFNSQTDYLAFGRDTIFSGLQDIDEKQFALFGEAALTLGKFEFTGGLRYFNWKQTFDLFFGGLAGARGLRTPLVANGKAKADGFNPRFVASVKPTDDIMIYAEAARGFRYGGVNQPVATTICGADLAAIGLTEGPGSFGPDNLWSYAIGSKNQFFDRRVTLNVSAFRVDWKDVQSTRNLACGYRFTENAGRVKSTGLEIESRFKITDAFSFTASGSYTKAEANGDLINIGARDGDRAPYFPKYIMNATADYVIPIGESELKLSADFQARGSSFTEFRRTAVRNRKIPSSEIFNLSATYDLGDWEVGVFGTNLTNNRAVSLVSPPTTIEPGDKYFLGRPRTIGMRAKRSF